MSNADFNEEAAYADGRSDQLEEDIDLLKWAYKHLWHRVFSSQEDALMLDRIKLLLEHGVRA